MTRLVAVTGASGFVGSHLVHHLARRGWTIRILARRMPIAALTPDAELDVVLGDLDDPGSLRRLVRGAGVVIHVAGIVKARHASDFQTGNVGGTRNLIAALTEEAPATRVIHISSLAAREPGLSPYAASKCAAEELIVGIAGRQKTTIIRPSAVYGPGDLELLPMFQAAARGLCPAPAIRGGRLSLIHVDDLAAVIAGAAEAGDLPEPCFEVDDGHPLGYTWAEIGRALAVAAGRRVRVIRIPRPVLMAVAALEEARQMWSGDLRALSLAKVPELYHSDWTVRGPDLWSRLGITPDINLNAGFLSAVDWYHSNHLL